MRGRMRFSVGEGAGRFQDEMRNFFEESLGRLSELWQDRGGELRPRADVYEDDAALTVHLELPGVPRAAVDVALVGRTLTVTADKTNPAVAQEEHLRSGERTFGRIRRSFELDFDASPDSVEAALKDGVLTLTVPRQAPEAAKKIPVREE